MRRLFANYLIVSLSVPFYFFSCGTKPLENNEEVQRYFCGGENLINENGTAFFDDNFGKFVAGGVQSEESFEGKYSIKLDSVKEYGMSLRFFDIEPGTYFETSIWIKNPVSKATLIVGATGRSKFSIHTSEINKADEKNGWSKYCLNFSVETFTDTLTFYPYASKETHFFDNLEIIKYSQRPALDDSLSAKSLKIYLPDSSYDLLNQYKEIAVQQDIISSDLKEYAEGYIINENDSIPIEIRLKGDWTDHIAYGKTSYRIKTDEAYMGLTTFSIQHPKTRNNMHEWFMHQLCDMEDLLSTTYDFLPVEINGVNQGIYAIEEHFDKQLLESRNRREGPILKIDESGFWALRSAENTELLNGSYPYYESAMITCFKDGRTEKNPVLSAQFENAAILLSLYKNAFSRPDQILDLKQTAKYYALMDLGNIHHSLAWHNRRYYYNPVTTKLEIIGFDMIPAIYPINKPIALTRIHTSSFPQENESVIDYFLFLNKDFRNYYTFYLRKFCSHEYLDSVFALLDADIKMREKLLSVEFPNYKLDRAFYYEKADSIQSQLNYLEEQWDLFIQNHGKEKKPQTLPPNYPELNSPFYLKEISVNAYRDVQDSVNCLLQLENFHLSNLTVFAYSTKAGDDSIFMLNEPIKLKRFDGFTRADYKEIKLPVKPNKIHFFVDNLTGVVHTKKVFNWPKPTSIHPRMELENSFVTISPTYKVIQDTLVISKGNYTINKMLYIPSKYPVKIEAGTSINLIDSSAIILNASTFIGSNSDDAVTIFSSDSTSQGVHIIQPDVVQFENVSFENLGTLNYKGWNLTGAVTIYEGDVSLNNVEIKYNRCEDGLNIIRGNFEIYDLNIHHTYGDGFDADFCTGLLTQSHFSFTGNDCIDFSGSDVTITEIKMENSGDKGISCGELSRMTVKNVSIKNAVTAIASKDGSHFNGENISAENCETGLAIYRKKPEYPAAVMILNNCNYQSILQLALMEHGAELVYNGKTYLGTQQIDIDELYARFSK